MLFCSSSLLSAEQMIFFFELVQSRVCAAPAGALSEEANSSPQQIYSSTPFMVRWRLKVHNCPASTSEREHSPESERWFPTRHILFNHLTVSVYEAECGWFEEMYQVI